jgi:hypothetical protein
MATLQLGAVRAPAARAALLAALDASREAWRSAAAMLALAPTADAPVITRIRASLPGSDWNRAAALAAMGLVPIAHRRLVIDDLAAGLFSPLTMRASVGDLPLQRVAARALVRATSRDLGDFRRVLADVDAAASISVMLARAFDDPNASLDGGDALVRNADAIANAARRALATSQGADRVLDALREPGRFVPLTGHGAGVEQAASDAANTLARTLAPEFAALATHPDTGIRRRVLPLLAAIDTQPALDALERATTDAEATIADTALRLLAVRAGAGAAQTGATALVARLAPTEPWKTRLVAAEALARAEAPGATRALVAALRSDPLSIVREAAARALAPRARDPDARGALEGALRDDVDEAVRAAALRALEHSP